MLRYGLSISRISQLGVKNSSSFVFAFQFDSHKNSLLDNKPFTLIIGRKVDKSFFLYMHTWSVYEIQIYLHICEYRNTGEENLCVLITIA